MLIIKNLTKTYPSGVQALKGVSLELSPGVFGLLGPNGSGKTTLMKIIATLLEPDSGTIEMNGADLITRKDHTCRLLGYLPQDFGLYPTLTAWQMLDYFAKLKGVTDKKARHSLIDALLERVNLSSERSQRLGEFSGGMRQRLGIAQALIGEPELIIVDEPTAGLDPEERNRFHNLISETASENTVVILSTHIVFCYLRDEHSKHAATVPGWCCRLLHGRGNASRSRTEDRTGRMVHARAKQCLAGLEVPGYDVVSAFAGDDRRFNYCGGPTIERSYAD
jgi:ABC-type Na+ transport system ATPase subunit NatA